VTIDVLEQYYENLPEYFTNSRRDLDDFMGHEIKEYGFSSAEKKAMDDEARKYV
jgi:hypothetical protein